MAGLSRHLPAAVVVSLVVLLPGVFVPEWTATSIAAELKIGSKAPALDIKHWVQDGEGNFGPVTTFEEGKVYVIQFWQTWSVSCTTHMDHVARVQADWADKDVQVIGVSDEDLDAVIAFLRMEDGQGKTFAEITKGYCLTTDPDGSVHDAYLGPTARLKHPAQRGDPVTFIVGKTGEIEWGGHPREMEEPIGQVVDGTWDRRAFVDEMRELAAAEKAFFGVVQPMIAAERYDDANALLDRMVGEATVPTVRERLVGVRRTVDSMRLGMAMQAGDEISAATFDRMARSVGEDAAKLGALASLALEKIGEGFPSGDRLLAAATAVAEKAARLDSKNASFLDTLAHIHGAAGRLDEAIATQKKAVALGGESAETRKAYLEELEAKAGQ